MDETRCRCGRLAATEIQTGWDCRANGGAGGGVYEPLCERCYAATDEARAHEAARARYEADRAAGRHYPGLPRFGADGYRWHSGGAGAGVDVLRDGAWEVYDTLAPDEAARELREAGVPELPPVVE